MQYDFDRVVDRSGNFAAKYDERARVFGRSDVIPLWVADMDFVTAQPVVDALVARAKEGIWGYTSRPASYFEAICGWQERRNGWKIDPALCSHALGVIPAIGSMIQYMTEPGDGILIQSPVYNDFFEIIQDNQRVVVENHMKEQADGTWAIDFADFEEKLGQVKMFLLCSPHNPLGLVWSREDLERMVELCMEKGVILISDEIHSDLVFRGKHIPTASLSEKAAAYVTTCISGTKTFNMAGLQASTTVFPNQEAKARFDRFWRNLEIHRNNAFSLVAMETAFREGEEWLEQLKAYIDGNFHYVRDFLAANVPQIKVRIPDATYLMWLDCRGMGMTQDQLVKFMVEEAGIGLSDGRSYCPSLDGFMRLNAACSRKLLEKAMGQLAAAWKARG